MYLIDLNYTLFGPGSRDKDREIVLKKMGELGNLARLSDDQFYLLGMYSAAEVASFLRRYMRPHDFLKVQEVGGGFFISGFFPSTVNVLLEYAEDLGLVNLIYSVRA